MKIIRYCHENNVKLPSPYLQYFGDMKLGVFDIETTGLKPADCRAVLCGIMEADSSGNMIQTQYFLDEYTDEAESELVNAVIEHLNSFDIILTYNGRHFDIPFMTKRAEILDLSPIKSNLYNLDLYLIINGHCGFKSILKNLKQSTVEDYLGVGLGREDEISGKESVDLYYRYIECIDPLEKQNLMDIILLHNHDDILQLYRILPVLKQCNMHSAMFKQGFPLDQIKLYNLRLTRTSLSLKGCSPARASGYELFSDCGRDYTFVIDEKGDFDFTLPVQSIKSNTFINLRTISGIENKLEHLPGYVNGFLILEEDTKRNYREINLLIREVISSIFTEINSPSPDSYVCNEQMAMEF